MDALLNVTATCTMTSALGPGVRAVVWVQGCPFNCLGCIAPDWIPARPARQVTPAALTDELLRDDRVTGLTFSGGEPMMQAEGLASLIKYARERWDLSLLCFTGFLLKDLRASPPAPGVHDLLGEVDVLIDGSTWPA